MKKSRRTFTAEFKAKVAIEAWKKEFLAGAGKVFDTGKDGSAEVKKLKKENEDLVHQIGQLSVDINWLKKKVL